MKDFSNPMDFIAELKRRAEAGEPLTLVPVNEDGEPTGEPPITSWPEPQDHRLN
jgi:hypothetical protein